MQTKHSRDAKILPVIMCGGSGTRVWPESRESLPKQFIPLVGARSTFQMAIDILSDAIFETPIVVSNHAYRFLIGEQLLVPFASEFYLPLDLAHDHRIIGKLFFE